MDSILWCVISDLLGNPLVVMLGGGGDGKQSVAELEFF